MRAARVAIGVYVRSASIALVAVSVIWVAALRFWVKQSRLRHGLMARGLRLVLTRILRCICIVSRRLVVVLRAIWVAILIGISARILAISITAFALWLALLLACAMPARRSAMWLIRARRTWRFWLRVGVWRKTFYLHFWYFFFNQLFNIF